MSAAETASSSERPTSDTPVSTSSSGSVTPMLRQKKKILVDPAVFGSPESPLFSTDDHARIHKQRMKLEMEVATLNQRLLTLRHEANKVKENVVSQGELTVLKAETRLNLSQTNSIKLNDLINLFTETTRDVSAAAATCDTLEQMIEEETRHRDQFVEESALVADVLSFHEYDLQLPHLLSQKVKPVSDYDVDAGRSEQKVKEIKNEMVSVESGANFTGMESSAALEMARSTEAQWNLKSAGALSLRNEIQRLQQYLAEGELQARDIEKSNESERAKLDEFVTASGQDVTDMDTRFQQASEQWKSELEQLEDQRIHLRQRVNSAAASYDRICAEIDELESAERADIAETEEEEEEVSDEQNTDVLAQQKATIQREISELNRKYKHTKRAVKRKESSLKASVRALNTRYHNLKEETQLLAGNLSQHSDSSYLQKEIASLIQKIDGSITELRSDLTM